MFPLFSNKYFPQHAIERAGSTNNTTDIYSEGGFGRNIFPDITCPDIIRVFIQSAYERGKIYLKFCHNFIPNIFKFITILQYGYWDNDRLLYE